MPLKVTKFREHAAECRRLAARAREPDMRDALVMMAETWDSLAADREGVLAKQSSKGNDE